MTKKPRELNFILGAGAIVLLFLSEVLAFEKVPNIEVGQESSEQMLVWAGNAIQVIEKAPEFSAESLRTIRNFISFLDELSPKDIEKNLAHFDHLQKLKDKEFESLYWLGVHNIQRKSWGQAEMTLHLNKLRAKNATPEYELVFLEALGKWPEFYKNYREVLELFEAYPEKLGLSVPLPPHFPRIDGLPLNTLHDIMIIVDISLKHHWEPEQNEFAEMLVTLSKAYEVKKAYRLAYEVLELLDSAQQSSSYKALINKLKLKSTENLKVETTKKALY